MIGAAKVAHALEDAAEAASHPQAFLAEAEADVGRRRELISKASADIAAELSGPADSKRLPLVLKVFGVLLIAGCVYLVPFIAEACVRSVKLLENGGMSGDGLSTIVVTFLHLAVMLLMAGTCIVFGVRLVRNQRRWAAVLSYGLYVLMLLGALCSIMLRGIDLHLVFYLVAFVVVVALQSYLDPTLREERREHRRRRQLEDRREGEAGVLGRDPSGKGYIALNFFNLFWIFVVASMVGLLAEELYHYFVVVPGQWQDRAGLLFGPFSPMLRLRRRADDGVPEPVPQEQPGRHLPGGRRHRGSLRVLHQPVHAVRLRGGGVELHRHVAVHRRAHLRAVHGDLGAHGAGVD